MKLLLTFLGVATSAIFALSALGQDTPGWHLIVKNDTARKAIRMADGTISDVNVGSEGARSGPLGESDTVTVFHALSPDGKKILYGLQVGAHARSHHIAIADADGKNMRTIVTGGVTTRVAWSPNSMRIAFVKGWNVYRIDVDGKNEKRINREPVSLEYFGPSFAADGRLIYAIDRGRDGRRSMSDLVIGDGDKETVLVKRSVILHASTSPDGSKLAVIVPDELSIRDLKTNEVQKYQMKEVNPKWRVTFFDLLWRRDGNALALGFGFYGGRDLTAMIPGEDHVGVLTLDGGKPAIKTYEVGDGYGLYAWVTDEDMRRRK